MEVVSSSVVESTTSSVMENAFSLDTRKTSSMAMGNASSLDMVDFSATTEAKNGTVLEYDSEIMGIYRLAFTGVLILIMFGMGCAVDYRDLVKNLKRPVGIAVGLCCQIFLMPILTYSLIKIFGFSQIHAIAFFLVGCAPGGNNSNVVTYLVRGQISLSVAMTSFSNLLNIATVPLWLFVFTTIENVESEMHIPFTSLATGLLSILIPISLGIVFRYKFPKKAPFITKVSVTVALVILIVALTTMIIIVKVPLIFSASTILPVAILPAAGMVIAYVLSGIPLLRLTRGARKAVALETGIQNSGLANTVLVNTFSDRIELMGNAITIPLMYTIAQSVYVLLIVICYRIWYSCISKSKKKHDLEQQESESSQSDSEQDPEKEPLDNKF